MAKSNEYNIILKDWNNLRQSFIYSIFIILLVIYKILNLLADLFSRNHHHYLSWIVYIFALLNLTKLMPTEHTLAKWEWNVGIQ